MILTLITCIESPHTHTSLNVDDDYIYYENIFMIMVAQCLQNHQNFVHNLPQHRRSQILRPLGHPEDEALSTEPITPMSQHGFDEQMHMLVSLVKESFIDKSFIHIDGLY